MSEEEAVGIVAAYEALLARAVEIASNMHFVNDEGKRLEFRDGQPVVVSCDDTSDGYGWTGVKEEDHPIPLAMLLADDGERARLLSEWKAERRRSSAAAQARLDEERVEEERRQYGALRAKFG